MIKQNIIPPLNVKIYFTTFEEVREKIQSHYDFSISLNSPYRLCNFKPAYGEIFQSYLEGYDAWGYCDTDMIFGRIEDFIPNMKSSNFHIGRAGHLSIFPNNERTNTLYRYKDAYKLAFSINEPLFFDEDTFLKILSVNGYVCHDLKIANLVPRHKRFYLKQTDYGQNEYKHIFFWNKGVLYRYFLDSENKMKQEEYGYIHFLKRPMEVSPHIDWERPLAIVPNAVFNIDLKELNPAFILKYSKNGLFWKYWENSLKPRNFVKRLYYRFHQNKINVHTICTMNKLIGYQG